MNRRQNTKNAIAPLRFSIAVRVPSNDHGGCRVSRTAGQVQLSHVLFASAHCPRSCNFISSALKLSNSPLSTLILLRRPAFPNVIIQYQAIKVFHVASRTNNSSGLLYIPINSPHLSRLHSVCRISRFSQLRVRRFFRICGSLRPNGSIRNTA